MATSPVIVVRVSFFVLALTLLASGALATEQYMKVDDLPEMVSIHLRRANPEHVHAMPINDAYLDGSSPSLDITYGMVVDKVTIGDVTPTIIAPPRRPADRLEYFAW